jgi:hypothetical protein
LASCTGHATKVSIATPSTSKKAAVPIAATKGIPQVILQIGTGYQDGALIQYCLGSSCRKGPSTQVHALPAGDPLLFIIDQAPRSARVQLTAPGAAVPIDVRALHPGTMMLYAPQVRAGSYVVRLDAVWKGRTASWVFTIKVPKA